VVLGSGQGTCGNTRCKYHDIMDQIDRPAVSSSTHKRSKVALHTLELPFGYSEGGEAKSALVKVVLCDKCVKKIMWKREQAKKARASGSVESLEQKAEGSLHESYKRSLSLTGDSKQGKPDERSTQRRRRSRSLSPSRDSDKRHKRR
jgi:protein FRA10AC1